MKSIQFLIVVGCVIAAAGCHKDEVAKGPSKGMLNLDNLTPEQKIAKIQADKTVPEQYKQLYIHSVQSQMGQGSAPAAGQGGAPR